MKNLLWLILLPCVIQAQVTHKFAKSGNAFTYQLNSGSTYTYYTALSIDVQTDTNFIRVFLDVNNNIVVGRTDVLQVGGVTITGSMYTKRTAIVSILPTGDYSCVNCIPTIYTAADGSKGVANYATTAQFLSSITRVSLLTDLKALSPLQGKLALLIGKTALTDNRGGFYMYDTTATGSEDTVFMNIIPSNATSTGRWTRIFQKARSYPQGIMVANGGVKTFYVSGTTDANGEITINMTADNTSTGTALFSEIWSITAQAMSDAASPAAAVQGYKKSTATNLKTTTWGFFKANAVTITLSLVYSPFSSIGAGTVVQFVVQGI